MAWRLIAVCVLVVLSATGCNTVRGIGDDFQAAGRAIKDAVTR